LGQATSNFDKDELLNCHKEKSPKLSANVDDVDFPFNCRCEQIYQRFYLSY